MKSLGTPDDAEVVDGDFPLPATPGDFGPPPQAASKELSAPSVASVVSMATAVKRLARGVRLVFGSWLLTPTVVGRNELQRSNVGRCLFVTRGRSLLFLLSFSVAVPARYASTASRLRATSR